MNDTEYTDWAKRGMAYKPIETKIAKKLVKAFSDAGKPFVTIYDGEERTPVNGKYDIMNLLFNLDEAFLITADGSWVRFIQGNEQDCISDYTLDIEDIIAPVNEYISKHWD